MPKVVVSVFISLAILLCILMMTLKASAAANLGLCSDYFSRGLFAVTPNHIYALRQDQYAVKGVLEPYVDDGVAWTVVEAGLQAKNVFSDPYNALYFLEKGDHVYILDRTGETVLSEGYVGFLSENNQAKSPLLQIALFADLKQEQVVLSPKEFSTYYGLKHQVAVIKEKPRADNPTRNFFEERRQRILSDMNAYLKFQVNNPNRFVSIVPGVMHELGPNQRMLKLQGSLEYSEWGDGLAVYPKYKFTMKDEAGKTQIFTNYWGQVYVVNPNGELLYHGDFPLVDAKQTQALVQPENTLFMVVNTQ